MIKKGEEKKCLLFDPQERRSRECTCSASSTRIPNLLRCVMSCKVPVISNVIHSTIICKIA